MTDAIDRRPRLAILASGDGSNMQAIADACEAGSIPASIAVVVSNQPGAGVIDRASRAAIPTAVVNHRDHATRADFDRALRAALQPHAPDLVILAGFMRILTSTFIEAFHGRLLNIHPSLLPKYPGLRTHARAIAAGDREHGATVHFVTEDLDSGPAALQATVPVTAVDSAETLAARVLEVEHRIYPLVVAWWASGRLRLVGKEVRLDGKCVPERGILYTEGMA